MLVDESHDSKMLGILLDSLVYEYHAVQTGKRCEQRILQCSSKVLHNIRGNGSVKI